MLAVTCEAVRGAVPLRFDPAVVIKAWLLRRLLKASASMNQVFVLACRMVLQCRSRA